MIQGTAALAVWRSKPIAWLCMESFCRMYPPKNKWELIIFEEEHSEQLGKEFFGNYDERLKKANCERIFYLTSSHKYPLSQKWIMMADNASSTSEYFCLCAADNYYSPYMLQDAEENIKLTDWFITPKGYFYDFHLDKILRYEFKHIIGLQMIARTEYVKQFPMDKFNRGVDTWFAMNILKHCNMIYDTTDHWKWILCTQGLNNISHIRGELIKDTQPPFFKTTAKLNDIVPIDITRRLKSLSRCLQLL